MGTAKPLFIEDFDPGKLFDGSEKSLLPRTMENMFSLVDIIPNSLPLLQGTRPLYETYKTLVYTLTLLKRNVAASYVQNATLYLKELVLIWTKYVGLLKSLDLACTFSTRIDTTPKLWM